MYSRCTDPIIGGVVLVPSLGEWYWSHHWGSGTGPIIGGVVEEFSTGPGQHSLLC